MADLLIATSARLQDLLLAYSRTASFKDESTTVTEELIRTIAQFIQHSSRQLGQNNHKTLFIFQIYCS